MALADNALCTLDDVKSYMTLSTSATAKDAELENLINYVSSTFEVYCDRKFVAQEYTEILNGSGSRTIYTAAYPISAVSSIHVDSDQDFDADALVDASYYSVINDIGIFNKDYKWPKGNYNIQVVYTAGYSTIPADLVLACVEEVARKFNRKTDLDVTTINRQDGLQVNIIKDLFLPSTKMILSKYRRNFIE